MACAIFTLFARSQHISQVGPPGANGQFVAVRERSLRVWLCSSLQHKALSALVIRKTFLFDRPKRCGRPLIFLDAILPISDPLFDSSQAQRLQNQSVYAEVVCRWSLYRSFLSRCY